MRFQLLARQIAVPVFSLALAATVAACSSSGSTSAASSPSASATVSSSAPAGSPSAVTSSQPASTSTPTVAGSASIAQIITNWEAFFDGKTDAAKKISLLQNGDKFSAIIRAQAGSGIASTAGAKVTAVKIDTATSATVSYNITLSGATALANQTGTAVYEGGIWKVGDVSFCQLLKLENGGKALAACNA
jgi:glucose/arabinose dehydrogenase